MKCNSCDYIASGGAFKKSFGRFWFGTNKCPKCNSKDIVESHGRTAPPPYSLVIS